MTDAAAHIAKPPSAVLKAAAWMGGALVSFMLVAITGREAAKGLATHHLMFYRSWISLAVVMAVAVCLGRALSGWRTPQLPLHMMRAVVHFGAQYSWLVALTLIPLAELTALEFTAPLWTAVLAPILIRERLTPPRIAAVVLGFIGTLLVLRPQSASLSTGAVFGIFAAVGFALHFIATRRLTRTDSPLTLLMYMMGSQSLISTFLVLPAPPLPALDILGWTAALAISGLGAHYSLIRAFSLADTIIVSPMDFMRLPLMAIVGAWIYSEPLSPLVLLGGAIVLFANVVNMWGERQAR